MKSILDEKERNELLSRINNLKPDSKPAWGRMNASRMLEHCSVSLKLAFNEIEPEYNEEFLKIGKIVKGRLFESEVFTKELPTTKEFLTFSSENFTANKSLLTEYIGKFAQLDPQTDAMGKHPYFGTLTRSEWGMLIWKHTNHHLVQFGL
ncbi:MAG: DUF1569 domain-containing protein [Ignavibacteriae bacterium]|nr:DUF1569 domain-containing protein [Ignavibacteriota bacterium]